MQISNKFTLIRIIAAPVFLALFTAPQWSNGFVSARLTSYIMLPFLALAEFTDFLDGFFARKLGEVSDFGKLFDPFADVILHLTTFACCVYVGSMNLAIYLFIVYREFGMTFLRMIAAKSGISIAARKGGKLKTVFYVLSAFVFLFQECLHRQDIILTFNKNLCIIAQILSIICLVLAYISFCDYLLYFRQVLTKFNNKK